MPGLFSSGDTSINYPAQPSYGEGMREALEAQVALLTGTKVGEADFSDFEGGLRDLVTQYEAPLRKQTAQIDTDVLRQTVLGDSTPETSIRYDEEGRAVKGTKDVGFRIVRSGTGTFEDPTQTSGSFSISIVDPEGKTLATGKSSSGFSSLGQRAQHIKKDFTLAYDDLIESIEKNIDTYPELAEAKTQVENAYDSEGIEWVGGFSEGYKLSNTPINTGLERFKGQDESIETEKVFQLDEFGEVIVDKSKAGQTVTTPGSRAERGMIDLLGDKRQVQSQVPDYEAYVGESGDLMEQYRISRELGSTETLEEFGRDHYNAKGKTEGRNLPMKFGDTGRQAGFDAQGNFLGLSALAEDIQAGNLSRQRERDLADVERLSGRFQDVMEDYRPGTAEAVTGAREVLESQRDRLTGGEGQISVPTTDTFGGAATPATLTAATLGEGPTLTADTTYDAATAAAPMALTAATSFDPSASVTGEGFTATADLQGGQISADPLRAALMTQAQEGLAEGLTDRETRLLEESQRARATLMGRTFDQKSAIEEAKAQVLEDRNRQAQNRAFAQQVLGQEAGLQESDLSRSLQAAMQNQAALNRAAEFTAGQGMQAQLANQAATNQALQAGMAAGLSQEALAAQQQQAREFANMQAQNRASEFGTQAGMQQDLAQAGIQQERDVLQAQLDQQGAAFGAEAAQQAALADQRQRQQAAQFGVGAQMDAERLNAQLAQQGALGYVDAATRLAALEDQTTLDPFSALLNRAGGGSLGQAGQVFGQANYGLSSGPQYLNPESGLGYISQMAANEASMYGAQQAANASRSAGLLGGLGALGGGLFQGAGAAQGFGKLFCWVAREVYGPMNPQWMQFRDWMFAESPRWFFNLYRRFGERFANWISDKPRIKAIIRKWMDSKIGDK